MTVPNVVREGAGATLAAVRMFNGAAAMVAPEFLLSRLGLNPTANPGGYYAFRMFGIRTVLIGAEILLWGPEVKERSLRMAPLIHFSDTALTAYAGWRRQIPFRTAVMATAISAANFALALLAQPPTRILPQTAAGASPERRDAAVEPAGGIVHAADGTPRVTVEQLLDMSQPQRDALFRAGTTGPIPDGDAEGTVLLADESPIGPTRGFRRWAALAVRRLAWSGKVFDARNGELVNKVSRLQVRAFRAKVYKAPSWFDGQAAIILDYSKTSLLARNVRDEIRLVGRGTYLGQVYWGKDRVLEFALAFPSRVNAQVAAVSAQDPIGSAAAAA
jgi:hypothetical protein